MYYFNFQKNNNSLFDTSYKNAIKLYTSTVIFSKMLSISYHFIIKTCTL